MANSRNTADARNGLNPGRMAAAAMAVGGILLALIATVWSIARFWELGQSEETSVADFTAAAALLLGAWAVGLLLWGGAEILRRAEDLLETWRALGGAGGGRGAEAGAAELQLRLLQQLVQSLGDLRDIALLSDQERTLRAKAESSLLAGQLESDVPALLREHNWREAQLRVQRARARFPSLPQWDALMEQVEQARAKFEAHDLETATREVNDLTSLGAWDRALLVVRELQHRHPGSQEAAELTRRVQSGLDKSSAVERARLMSLAQEATTKRNWSEAMRLVEIVLARYPQSAEAHDLRQQLPTLKLNVEIQARQQMETEIRDLIKEHRYGEALRRARELIDRYPDSPQAAVLREQLPRLQEKAGAV